jgi:alpha-galactosidase/6-phospho-beta-glucosidase family protein
MPRATKKDKTEEVKAKEPTRNSLRNQAERFILDKYRDEYHEKAAALFAEKGWEYTRRSTPEEQEAKRQEVKRQKDEAKLQKLLEESPYLREKLAQAVPTHAEGALDLTGDLAGLNNTGAVGA